MRRDPLESTSTRDHDGVYEEVDTTERRLETAEERDTPSSTEMDRLGKLIAIGAVGIVAVIAPTELVVGDTHHCKPS